MIKSNTLRHSEAYAVSPDNPDSQVAIASLGGDVIKYRPDIDGLRAIAVLSVVGFHAAPGRVPGGFVGVDIFFVISGFLISTIIMKGLNNNVFSFTDFYIRRIKRIVPALLLVCSASLFVGALTLVDDDFHSLGKHVAAGAAFFSNFTLWAESGYFDSAANFKPLLHLWSLGIEEQFYILWPLMLWTVSKRERGFLALTLTVALISFTLNVYQVGINPTAAFYLPQTRFWELLLGCGIALTIERTQLLKAYHRDIISIFGITLLMLSFVLVDKNRHFPGWWSLFPTFGTALLIWAGPSAVLNRKLLSNSLLVWFGLISFPLYLWHWPVLSFLRILEGTEITQIKRSIAVAVSIGLAWATYQMLEKPIRRAVHGSFLPHVLIAGMSLACAAGLFVYNSPSFDWRPVKPIVMNTGEVGPDHFLNFIHLQYFPCTPVKILEASDSWNGIVRCFQSKAQNRKDLAIIGDSHAEHLFPGVAGRFKNRNIVFYGMDGLPFLTNPDYSQIYAYVSSDPKILSVVIAAAWDRKLRRMPIDDWRRELALTIDHLTSAGKRVYLIDDVPSFSFQPNRCKYAGRLGIENKCSEMDNSITSIYTPIFKEISARHNAVQFLSIHGTFCSGGLCSMANNGSLLFRDEHHLTLQGSNKVAASIFHQMPKDW